MRGRKPTPTAIRILHNNPGRRPLNDAEPQHDALDETCPVDLVDPVARAEWDRIVHQLGRSGHVTSVDQATLIAYCLKYAQWRTLETLARLHPPVVQSPSGYPIPNPAIGMANKCLTLMLKAAAELGITPSARSRVSAAVVKDEDQDPFTQYQRARPPIERVK